MNTSLSISSHHNVVESNEVSPKPPLLQAYQTQCPQPFLTGRAFQLFYQFCCPPLSSILTLKFLSC